ncbi:SAM-dependent methyltransferase [Arthrobacter frigidicola]|nr:SAM-dependent methyltransferase [Arthrobacter frigidicola]
MDPGRRRSMAAGYLTGAGRYDRVRPSYPEQVVKWLVPPGADAAADLGAGTGIFTRMLLDHGLAVTAVDPSADMLSVLASRLPGAAVLAGTAESTGLPGASVDLATLAQAWHWVDPAAAAAEAARILVPGGTLGVLWNQLDVGLPWVHRLSRIMHAGDVYSPGYRPDFGPLFTPPEPLRVRWTQELDVAGVVDLAKSRSYYQRASEAARARLEENLRWYLHDYLAFPTDAVISLPYFTYAWRARTHTASR